MSIYSATIDLTDIEAESEEEAAQKALDFIVENPDLITDIKVFEAEGEENDGLGPYECAECGSTYHPTGVCPNVNRTGRCTTCGTEVGEDNLEYDIKECTALCENCQEKPDAVCENCGAPCYYDSEMCLCDDCLRFQIEPSLGYEDAEDLGFDDEDEMDDWGDVSRYDDLDDDDFYEDGYAAWLMRPWYKKAWGWICRKAETINYWARRLLGFGEEFPF